MSRKARQASETGYYHVITRGNNKQRIFHGAKDFKEYLKQISIYHRTNEINICHYCLMNNHAHMLIEAQTLSLLSKFMHSVQRAYHHYYRKKYTLFGHLFQGRFKSLPINDERYLLECGRYIERNPVAAKIVQKPEKWEYSSNAKYIKGVGADWLTYSPAFLGLAEDERQRKVLYKRYVEVSRPYDEVLNKQVWKD